MPFSTVETAIISASSRSAQIISTLKTAISSDNGTSFWDLVDATSNIPYENAVKGDDLSSLDTDLTNINIGALFGPWFNRHEEYARVRLGLAYGFREFLQTRGIRLHESFGKIWLAATGTSPEPYLVFADQSLDANILGTLTAPNTGSEFTSLSSGLENTRLGIKVTTNIGAITDLTLTVVVRNSAMASTDTSKTITVVVPKSTQTSAAVIDLIASSVASSGFLVDDAVNNLTTIKLGTAAERNNFVVGSYAQLRYGTTLYRNVEVTAIGTTDTIVVKGLWTGDFTYIGGFSHSNIKVYPLYNEVVSIAGSGQSVGAISIVPIDDYSPAW